MDTELSKPDRDQLGQLIREMSHRLVMLTQCDFNESVTKAPLYELKGLLDEWIKRGYDFGPDKLSALDAIELYSIYLEKKEKLITRPPEQAHAVINKNISSVIKERRSIRFWKEDKVPSEVVEKIIEMASCAPSAFNRMPWKFYVCEYHTNSSNKEDSTNESMFLRAPAIIYIAVDGRLSTERYSSAIEAGALMQNTLLSAHALGLGACPVYQCEMADQVKLHHDLNIPEYFYIYCAVVLGYPDEIPFVNRKVSVDEVIVFI